MQTLREIRPGEEVTVVKIHGDGGLRQRFMDMGITKGTVVQVRRVAPLGDPMEIMVRGYELSLRKEDAVLIEVRQ
jgi:ferrous iron transport protein A